MNLTLPQRESLSSPVLPFNLLEDSTDWRDFCLKLSDDTADNFAPHWWANVQANAALIRRKGSAYDRYRGQGQDKAVVLIGASPALKNNYANLFSIQNDPDFILLATSSSLKFLLDKGIKPRFVIIADGAADVAPKLDVKDKAKGITLIATTITHPNSLKNWQGNVRFIKVRIGDKYEKEHTRITRIKDEFPGGGTQYNAAVLFAYMTLKSRILVFVGNELSYDAQYYVDRPDTKDGHFQKFPWMNIQGGVSYTNLNFIQAKIWLENTLGIWKGVFINATEAGILGTSKRYGSLDYIRQMKLSNTIAYVKEAIRQFKEVN